MAREPGQAFRRMRWVLWADDEMDPSPTARNGKSVWPYPRVGSDHEAEKATDGAGPHAHPWGISLSGGGVRSASFCLGALQAMERRGMLHGPKRGGAHYLSAVSGGSYIAGAYAMLARQREGDGSRLRAGGPLAGVAPFHRAVAPPVPPEGATAPVRASKGPAVAVTPEERYLYDHTLYLTHGPGRVVGALWRLTLGIVWNLVFLGVLISLVALSVGLVLRRIYPSLVGAGLVGTHVQVHTPAWASIVLAALAGGALGVGLLSMTRTAVGTSAKVRRQYRIESASRLLLGATALWLLVLAIPYAVEAFRWVFARHGQVGALRQSLDWTAGISIGLSATAGLARIRGVWAHAPRLSSPHASAVWSFVNKHRTLFLSIAATLAGVLLVASAFLWWATAALTWSARKAVVFLGGGLVLLALLWWTLDLNAWSPHSYYFRRLASMFAIRRVRVPDPFSGDRAREPDRNDPSCLVPDPSGGDSVLAGAAPIPEGDPLRSLTGFQPDDFPEVLICASANVARYGTIPTGFNATSFVLSAGVVGGPLVGAVPTEEYERALGDNTIDLPEAVSISGAAVAPEMGKMTRNRLRFLMALANVRLGVWIINPRWVAAYQDRRRRPPKPGYLLTEALGRAGLHSRYLYVSDGGHYENLGLVEQLRRGCEWVFCVDAAGDAVDTFHMLGQAIAIAKAELGVDIGIAPERDMAPEAVDERASAQDSTEPPHAPWVKRAFSLGTIRYPNGTTGTLVYIKAGVPSEAPWDVRNYAEAHRGFPTDPTLDQLFNAERMEAYRALGEFAAESALQACWPVFSAWRQACDRAA